MKDCSLPGERGVEGGGRFCLLPLRFQVVDDRVDRVRPLGHRLASLLWQSRREKVGEERLHLGLCVLGHQQREIRGGGEGGDVGEIGQDEADQEPAEEKRPIRAVESRVLEGRVAGKSDQVSLQGGVVVLRGDRGKELDANTADTNPGVWHLGTSTLLVDRQGYNQFKLLCYQFPFPSKCNLSLISRALTG